MSLEPSSNILLHFRGETDGIAVDRQQMPLTAFLAPILTYLLTNIENSSVKNLVRAFNVVELVPGYQNPDNYQNPEVRQAISRILINQRAS